MRIEPQICLLPLPPLRLAGKQCVEPTTDCSRPPCEKPAASSEACDRYESGVPGTMLYADYLEKQNQRKVESQSTPAVKPDACDQGGSAESAPADTGLGPKLGDIPAPKRAMSPQQRLITAYQVQRFAPTGSLVDVLI